MKPLTIAEREVLTAIRRRKKTENRRWKPGIGTTTVAWYNAIERLEARGRIRYVRNRRFEFSGYEAI